MDDTKQENIENLGLSRKTGKIEDKRQISRLSKFVKKLRNGL